ncbi:MAG: hypothetical protein R3C19_23185 [Planctomycetaceae bacterium]
MKRRIVIAFGVAVVFSNAVLIWKLQGRTGREARSLPNSPEKQQVDLAQGAVIQRQRIDDFIQRVRVMSLTELEKSLSDLELVVTFSGLLGSSPSEASNQFERILADRRVAKLYAAYRDSGEIQARSSSLALFEVWFTEHQRRLERAIEFYEQHGGYQLTIGLDASNYACAASLFLMSNFCSPEEVLDAIQRWTEVGRRGMARVHNDRLPAGAEPLDTMPIPEDLLVVNVCLACLLRNLGPVAFSDVVNEPVRIPEWGLTTLPLAAWDAHTNPFDFTHIHKGVPFDESALLANFTYIRSFSSIYADHDDAREGVKNRVLAAVAAL